MPSQKINICGILIDNASFSEVADFVQCAIKENRHIMIVTPNVDHIVRLQKDEQFRRIYDEAALVLADGMPLLWAARFLNTPLKARIAGSDLFPELCNLSEERGYRIFLLGGRSGAASKTAEEMKKKYPKLKITGHYSPPFGFEQDAEENEKIIEMIKAASPDILFVGLGTPKQEKWIYKYRNSLCVPVSIGVGATFEFVSGMVRRAPKWMQSMGLEWFWRLCQEPRRLWKRYLWDDPVFFWLLFMQKIRRKNINS